MQVALWSGLQRKDGGVVFLGNGIRILGKQPPKLTQPQNVELSPLSWSRYRWLSKCRIVEVVWSRRFESGSKQNVGAQSISATRNLA